MPYRTGAALAAIALLLTGCSDPKAASDANFRATLQSWFDEHPVCATLVTMGEVPIVREARGGIDQKPIDAAVSAGLLSVEPFRAVSRFGTAPEDFRRYTPTDKGKAAIRKDDRGWGSVDICFARRQIDSIENYTEPADMAGIHLSRVTYRYSLADVAPWVNDTAIKAALPAIGRTLAKSPAEATDTLMLTNKGWQHERSLQK
jgi:hypothetical protein